MSYSVTIRQASLYADASQMYWDIMFRIRKDLELPKGAFLDFQGANLVLSTRESSNDDITLRDGSVVNYNTFFTCGMVVQYFTELEYHCLNGGQGTVCDKVQTTDAREARRMFAFWILQFSMEAH